MKQNTLVLHSFFAFFVLLILAVATINAFVGWKNRRDYYRLESDLRISRLALIVLYMQLVIGLILFYRYPSGLDLIKEVSYNQMNFSDKFLTIVHPSFNLLAIVIAQIGWLLHVRYFEARKKFKTIAIFYFVSLILVLLSIPWDRWFTMEKFS